MGGRGLAGMAVVALSAAVVPLGGCTDSATKPDVTAPTPAQQLAAAKAAVDRATSMHLVLESKNLPQGVTGVVGADGVGAHPPAFKGTFKVTAQGTQASVDVVAVEGKVYTKLPFTSIFVDVDPKALGAPDPASLFAPDTGVTSLLTATQNPTKGPATRKGSEVLTTITGTLAGAKIADLLIVGDRSRTFTATYGITEPGGELRSVDLVGPFYPAAASTYTVTLDKYGEPVDIKKP